MSGSPQQARQMTDCGPAGSGAGGGRKSQKQPRPCAYRHCGVNVPPSGSWSLSRLGGWGQGKVQGGMEAKRQRHRGTQKEKGRDRWGDEGRESGMEAWAGGEGVGGTEMRRSEI